MATTYTTSNEGAFTFLGKTYKIEGDSRVIFYIDDDGNVTGVNDLDGTITADFENGLTINGETIQVTGDKNNLINVTATTENGVSAIGGVNGDEVTILKLGSASNVITTSSGTFTINSTTFTVDDKSGVNFELTGGVVTGVTDLDGTITADFSTGFNVNGTPIKVTGGNVTATVANGVVSVATPEGSFNIGNRNFTVTNTATFIFDDKGNVTGVTDFVGSITFIANGLSFSVNGVALTIGVNDEVTISTDENGNITGISNFDTYIFNLPPNTTIAATDKNITVNGTAIAINEGSNTSYTLSLDEQGNPTQASALSDGTTINNVPENMQLVTDENGSFRIGNRTYTISGDDGGVTFYTDAQSKVTALDNLDGAIFIQGDVSLNVNGSELAIDKVVSAADTISIYGGKDGIYNVYGLQDGDSISGNLDGAAISLLPDSTIYINNNPFQLSNDIDGVIIIPNSTTTIKYFSPNSTFILNNPGSYIFTNDDNDATSFYFDAPATVISDSNGVISAYSSNDFNLDSNSTLDDIINFIAKSPLNYVNLKTPLTSFDSSLNYNLNLVFFLDNPLPSTAYYDFSDTSLRKRVSLAGGNQNITLNNATDNIIAVPPIASGHKFISLIDSDNLIVDATNASVSISALNSNIISKSDIFISSASSSNFTPLNNSSFSFFNYNFSITRLVNVV